MKSRLKINTEANENKNGKDEYQDLENILNRHKRIFSCSSADVGCVKVHKHQIDIADHLPKALNPHRVPTHLEDKVDELVTDLERKKIVVHVSSPWNFPVVVVPKKVIFKCV